MAKIESNKLKQYWYVPIFLLLFAFGYLWGQGQNAEKDAFDQVDGKVVNIPSYSVKPGQIVGVREKAKSLEVIETALAGFNHSKYPWIEWDDNSKSGKFLHKPERADIPENIKEQLIVELYSK